MGTDRVHSVEFNTFGLAKLQVLMGQASREDIGNLLRCVVPARNVIVRAALCKVRLSAFG
jgi:hypothetical protein